MLECLDEILVKLDSNGVLCIVIFIIKIIYGLYWCIYVDL